MKATINSRAASVRAALCAALWLGWVGALGGSALGCNAIDSSLLAPIAAPPDQDSGVDEHGMMNRPDSGFPDGGISEQRDCLGLDELDTCARAHALTVCIGLECALVECTGAYVDCDQDGDNGCEATLDSTDHCGLCGAACTLANATTRCSEGACELDACKPGFGDCDTNPSNGCETSLKTLDNCGACNATCDPVENGVAGCATGDCGVGACVGPFGDCDEGAENGCEEPLASNDHCGGCELSCEPESAVGDCASGACVVVSCTSDRIDCNGLPADGCEATLDSADNCGRCGASCELPHTIKARCDTTAGASCTVDHACASGANGCVDDALENGCAEGYADCNGVGSDGCEARLDTLNNCGGCGDACAIPNAIISCSTGSCELVECEPGFGQCDGEACLPLADDEANCGACDVTCSGDKPNCFGGKCTSAVCPSDTADCDDNGSCEAALDGTAACGLCDVSCGPFAHASAACTSGRCTIATCDPGFDNCDGVAPNGCEVDLHTLDTCGSCTTSCVISGAEASCSTGTCTFVECNPDRGDCEGGIADGCETNISLPNDCGACGLDCRELPHVLAGGCFEMECSIICENGYADCDGDEANGCEQSLSSAGTCGSCGIDCDALAHVASASCGENGCEDLICEPGFANCDGIPSNGCERSTQTLTDCGSCNAPCAPARATGDCADGTCDIAECDPGFDDCDNFTQNGCESSLTDPDTCGTCSNTCTEGWACTNGTCACTSSQQCPTNQECCNGSCVDTNGVCSWWPCPVAATNHPLTNCGACGTYCPTALPGSLWCCAVPP